MAWNTSDRGMLRICEAAIFCRGGQVGVANLQVLKKALTMDDVMAEAVARLTPLAFRPSTLRHAVTTPYARLIVTVSTRRRVRQSGR